MIDTEAIAERAYDLARRDFSHQFGGPEQGFREKPIWQKVRALGTRLWLDTGDIDEAKALWCCEFEALTTNNTLLNREIQKGFYDRFVREVAEAIRRVAPEIDESRYSPGLVLEIAFVLNAYHALRLVEMFDAHVSVELHTDLGHDVERSVAYGKRYFDICPERFYVKVPLTAAGLLAARRLGAEGVPVNFTLGFSARQNYAAALIAQPRFVNVFMGRLNAFVADNRLGDGRNVGEKATLAAQRMLIGLRDTGRTRSLLIGASMREGSQVAALAGLDVLTMPTKAAAQYEDRPAGWLSPQIDTDPGVPLADGISFEDFNAATLWDVPDAFKGCVAGLLDEDVDSMTAENVQFYFGRHGFEDFLPDWSTEDIETVAADGKIPVLAKWKQRLSRGEIGLDALMNLSAFEAFATDQKALDDRIRSLI
ncbi:MAG TPA: transaldolase family protein [Sedimentisphaerales bacterium]|nr:transaldolase family protein [Sedimentisphaerales bacterium]HRS11346.1 transaldolase family protein [Sedimentisphaerales bacterium]HRV47918.1 transaldolase family protein [Sedimentisphaerales bacterium]